MNANEISASAILGSGLTLNKNFVAESEFKINKKVYDCFTFLDEEEILELRLEYLKEYISIIVISQANITHRGKPWNPILNSSHKLVKKYKNCFEFRFVSPENSVDSIWGREKAQRKALNYGLYDIEPHDLILINDVDEIPSREQVKDALKLGMNCYHSIPMEVSVNYVNVANRGLWKHGKAVSAKKFTDAQIVREKVLLPTLQGRPGRHLTVVNGEDGWRRKFEITPHLEMQIDLKLLKKLIEFDLYPMLDGIMHPGGGRLKRINETEFDDLLLLAYKLMRMNFKENVYPQMPKSKKKEFVAQLWLNKILQKNIELDPNLNLGVPRGMLLQSIYLMFLPFRIYRWMKSRLFIRSRINRLFGGIQKLCN